jgi:hypothetical protein
VKSEPQSLMPTADPTRDDVLYFAGFYDGEGSARRTTTGGVTVLVPQKDPEPLFRARSLWGGSLRRPTGRDITVWVISGDRARNFLIAIFPFLTARRKKQIEDAGGLDLTGKTPAKVGGVSAERKSARASMTQAERHSETCLQWAKNNPEKAREISARYRDRNRERVNARQRERRAEERLKSYTSQPEIAERRELVN